MGGRQILQHIGGGRVFPGLALLAALQPHLVEQDFTQLRGTADIEAFPGKLVDFGLEPRHFLGKGIRHPAQHVAVDLDARHLHPRQHRHQGPFQRLVNGGDLRAVQLRPEALPQPPGDIGILGGIGGGVGDRHPVKGDLGFARPDQVLDGDRHMAEIPVAQRVHPVPVQARVHRVGHQHRVVDGRNLDPVARQNFHIVFGVLQDFQNRGILQHRLQHIQRRAHRHLPVLQRIIAEQPVLPALAMGQRDIGRLPRPGGQRKAHQLGRHLVQSGRLGVDRHFAARIDPVDPDLQRRRIADHLIGGTVHRRHLGRRRLGRGVGARRVGVGDRRGLDPQMLGDAAGKRAELHLPEEFQQGARLGVAHFQVVQCLGHRHPVIQRHQLLRQPDLVGEFDQGLAALGLLDLFGPGQKRVQVAVFIDQQGRRLHPDPRRAGDVVDAVARQRLHIDHPFGADAEFCLDTLAVDAQVLHRIQHLDPAADQLHQVLVGTDDRAAPPGLARLPGQCGDDVIGLVSLKLEAGDVEGAGRLAGQGDLRAQVFGHLVPVGLVEVVDIVAERVRSLVEHHRRMGRRIGAGVPLDHPEHHVAESADRPDGQAIGFPCQRRQRVIGTEDERRSVHQMQVMSLAECHVSPLSRVSGYVLARPCGLCDRITRPRRNPRG